MIMIIIIIINIFMYIFFAVSSGADICSKCWPLMVIAVKIIDRALRGECSEVEIALQASTLIF